MRACSRAKMVWSRVCSATAGKLWAATMASTAARAQGRTRDLLCKYIAFSFWSLIPTVGLGDGCPPVTSAYRRAQGLTGQNHGLGKGRLRISQLLLIHVADGHGLSLFDESLTSLEHYIPS